MQRRFGLTLSLGGGRARGRPGPLLPTALLLALCPGVVMAGPPDDGFRPLSVAGADAPAQASGDPLPPGARDLSAYHRASFIDDRHRLATRLVEASEAVAAGRAPLSLLSEARLNLAEFYTAHVMLAEARSLLRPLDLAAMPPVLAGRVLAQRAAVSLLAGDRPVRPEPLGPEWKAWPDQPLWKVLSHALARAVPDEAPVMALIPEDPTAASDLWEEAEPEKAAPVVARPAPPVEGRPTPADLAAAVARLSAFPAPFVEAVLPGLLELAIDLRSWGVARDLARRFDDHAALRDGESYYYLLGRAAEAGDARLVAFDNYVRASEGMGRDAQRARLALVSLGLASRSLRPEEARDLMAEAKGMWRGDELAVTTLRRLARIELSLGNPLEALLAYGEVIVNYPGHSDAPLIRQKANVLLDQFYDAGARGELPLSEFLTGHRRLAIHYRFEDDFARHAESFADTLLAAGATSVASAEYDAVHDYLSVSRDLGLQDIPEARTDALRVKQIRALIAGGQHEEAAMLLSQARVGASPEQEQRLALLAARIYALVDDRSALLATRLVEPTPGYKRLMAEARFANTDWAAARDTYRDLWLAEGNGFPFRDAISLLLAAHRSGDVELTRELARAFPALTDVPQWAEIAQGLTEPAAAVDPLASDGVRSRMERAGRTLDNLATIDEGILR